MGGAGGSASSRRVDPRGELQAATERNAREAREEREAEERRAAATEAAQETMAESAEAQAAVAAKAQAEAEAAERAAEALRSQPPQLVIPLRFVLPDIPVPPPEEIGRDPLAMERDEGDVVVPEGEVVLPPSVGTSEGGQPEVPPEQPVGGEPTATADLVVLSPTRRRTGRAASEPDPQRAAGSSSLSHDLESATASSSGWTPGGGTAALNLAAQDVRSRLQAQATALHQCTREFLATRAVDQVSFLAHDFFRGGALAHQLGVVPEFRAGY